LNEKYNFNYPISNLDYYSPTTISPNAHLDNKYNKNDAYNNEPINLNSQENFRKSDVINRSEINKNDDFFNESGLNIKYNKKLHENMGIDHQIQVRENLDFKSNLLSEINYLNSKIINIENRLRNLIILKFS